ncbi:MAG TPA: hypothetical protein VFS58_08255 [Steroidobacteraceae bacterium]|nr:hypothetical protein [Steroidobacteraceae bacterium]
MNLVTFSAEGCQPELALAAFPLAGFSPLPLRRIAATQHRVQALD